MKEYLEEKSSDLSIEDLLGVMSKSVPIQPPTKPKWQKLENPQRLQRNFSFESTKQVLSFLTEVLEYEEKENHNGAILVNGKEISIEVYTHDLDAITELDIEYAEEVGNIFTDVIDYERE
jgi:pterin-4a-carbinolamine dehydratase